MPVSFNSIPANWRMPLYWVEVDPSMAGYPQSRLASLLIGTMLPTGTATPDVPVPVPSVADARQLFGYGSMLDGMVDFFTKNNFAQELWVVPIKEATAGVAATGKMTVTAAAVSAGTLPVYVSGRRVQVFVAAGEDMDTTATNIAAAITADPSMPVTAVATAAEVDLTCKWKGVEGNDIDIRLAYGGALAAEQVPIGLTITLPTGNKLAGGTGEVDLTNAIANLGDEPYEYVATAYTDSTSLALLEAEYGFGDSGRWGWMRQLYGHTFAARRGIGGVGDPKGYGELLQYGPNNNSGVVSAGHEQFADTAVVSRGGLHRQSRPRACQRSGSSIANARVGRLPAAAQASALHDARVERPVMGRHRNAGHQWRWNSIDQEREHNLSEEPLWPGRRRLRAGADARHAGCAVPFAALCHHLEVSEAQAG